MRGTHPVNSRSNQENINWIVIKDLSKESLQEAADIYTKAMHSYPATMKCVRNKMVIYIPDDDGADH